MNRAIVHHKTEVKCSICGKGIMVDSVFYDEHGEYTHLACTMESTGIVYDGDYLERLNQYRKQRDNS